MRVYLPPSTTHTLLRSIWMGQRIDGTVRLVGHDRVPCDVPHGALVVNAVVEEGGAPGAVPSTPGPTPSPISAVRVAPGVYTVSVPVPGARDRSRLVVSARVGACVRVSPI
jgi:hypothetical protein